MHSSAAPIRRDLIHFPLKKRIAGHVLGLVAIGLRMLAKCRVSNVECRMEGKSPKEVGSAECGVRNKKEESTPSPPVGARETEEEAAPGRGNHPHPALSHSREKEEEQERAQEQEQEQVEGKSALTLPSPPGEGAAPGRGNHPHPALSHSREREEPEECREEGKSAVTKEQAQDQEQEPKAEGKRVMILEPFGLGDIISFEPLIRELKKRDYQIVLSGRSSWKALYPEDEQLKWIDAVLPWSSVSEEKKYRLKDYRSPEFREYIGRLRREAKGAIGLDTRGDIRSVAVLHLTRCREVLALENYLGSNLTVTPGAAKRVRFEHELYRWQLNLRFLELLEPGFDASKVTGPFFGHLAKGKEEKPKRIGLVPVAPWAGKLWEPEKWKELIEELKKKGWEVIGLCGPGQSQTAKQQLNSNVPVKECDSIEGWAEAFSQCQTVVSLDTGPMHLADALGMPTIALFGQGNLPLWAPSNQTSGVVTHQSDTDFVLFQPVDENTESGRKFMHRITVDEVIKAIANVLKNRTS